MTRPQFKKSFKEWLKSRRQQIGLTQEELAEKTGLTGNWICHFEQGRRLPDAYAFYNLQKFLGAF